MGFLLDCPTALEFATTRIQIIADERQGINHICPCVSAWKEIASIAYSKVSYHLAFSSCITPSRLSIKNREINSANHASIPLDAILISLVIPMLHGLASFCHNTSLLPDG
jgi:hypothetical protein